MISRRGLLLIVVLALVARVVWIVVAGPTQIEMDGAEYARTGANLLAGHGLLGMRGATLSVFPPLYSLLIALLIPLSGSAEAAGTVISVVAGTLMPIPLYFAARYAYGERAGIFAAFLAAFFPFSLILSGNVLSDGLFIALTSTALYFWLRAADAADLRDAVLCGAIFSIGYLVRPEAMIAAVIAAASLAVFRHARSAAALLAAFAIVAAPYVLYEWHSTGHFSMEGKTAINYYIGVGLRAGKPYWATANAIDDRLRPIGPELTADGGGEVVVAKPTLAQLADFCMRNAVMHVRELFGTVRKVDFGTALLPLLAFIGLLYGPWDARRRKTETVFVLFGIAFYIGLSSVFQFWERYAATFIPLVVVWAARGFDELTKRLEPRVARLTVATGAVVYLLIGASVARAEHAARTPSLSRETAAWLRSADPTAHWIMDSDDIVPFYAGALWMNLPWAADSRQALAFIARQKPDYLVLRGVDGERLPYTADWLRTAIPDRRAVLLRIQTAGADKLYLYRWNGH